MIVAIFIVVLIVVVLIVVVSVSVVLVIDGVNCQVIDWFSLFGAGDGFVVRKFLGGFRVGHFGVIG